MNRTDNEVPDGQLYEHYAFQADQGQEPLRVDKFLMNRIENATRNKIQQAAKLGAIRVNESLVKSNHKVKGGDKVKVVFSYPCDEHDKEFYPTYKKRCDEYFWNAHRGEARGIGGLFFDYLRPNDQRTAENWFSFVTEIGDSFLDAYVPIVEKRKNIEYTEAHREWQEVRRGRYVEFNLIHDKGTLFGLKTNGRIESILMSLPPFVQWQYNYKPDPKSKEEVLVNVLENPQAWV